MRRLVIILLSVFAVIAAGCSVPAVVTEQDETAQAVKLVEEGNADLSKIKILYQQNESKREELKQAMESNNAAEVKRIAEEAVRLIDDGSKLAKSAVNKISDAQEMKINEDYKEYLRLKTESLKKQMAAFEEYRSAARSLRDTYDPTNTALRDKVKEEFQQRADNYLATMDDARYFSMRANDLVKEIRAKERN